MIVSKEKYTIPDMEEVKYKVDKNGDGAFIILDGLEQVGEMVTGLSGNNLTVYHTEVSPQATGKGLARKLLAAMVAYARDNGYKVIPICPFVHAQFKRHPEEYADIWNKKQ